MMAHTFKTKLHRGQLTVADFAGEHAKYGGAYAGKVYFTTRVLSATAHKATAFSAGEQLYHGECLLTALAYLGNHIGQSSAELLKQLPVTFDRYKDQGCI